MKKFPKAFVLLLLVLVCCRKPYTPPQTSTPDSYLVVEGVINFSVDSTVIILSRTVKLNDKVVFNPELGATVTIEAQNDNTVHSPLIDINNNGHYFNYDIALPTNDNYRIRIVTSAGREYVSDFVPVKLTPPIDSVGYSIKNGAVNLYANAHDPANATRYYRYDFEETYIFHAKYESDYVLNTNNNAIVPRGPGGQVYYCFGHDVSSNIILASTVNLGQDLVYQAPITQVPLSSEKLGTKYSILVKQYALTQPAYLFYQTLKKNNEGLGSIFDPQPSEISGNVHSLINANEPVIGYISATTVQTKRIFIDNAALPNTQIIYPYDCVQDTALLSDKQGNNDVLLYLTEAPVVYIPTTAVTQNGGIIGYLYSSPICADCTLRGTTQAPYYWPSN